MIVNAIQRHSTVIVQKSLAEGFGLTVSDAMWKSRPVTTRAYTSPADHPPVAALRLAFRS